MGFPESIGSAPTAEDFEAEARHCPEEEQHMSRDAAPLEVFAVFSERRPHGTSAPGLKHEIIRTEDLG